LNGDSDVYAIIQTRGRQVKVTPGATITVDGTMGSKGDEITFDQVLLVGRDDGAIEAGAPTLGSARVIGVVEGDSPGPKLRVFKKKRRKGMRRTRGHRAVLTRVRIKDIVG
jgi:large subunit ribosomal protein L21